jgi:hypothetical protein
MMSRDFKAALEQIEAQLHSVAEALGTGDAARLEVASAGLQQISMDLAQLVEGRSPQALAGEKARLERIAGLMAIQREGLIRQAAHVERTLGILIPSAKPAATYGRPVGAHRYTA